MKVILFGATGMVGQGALRECLLDPDVEQVLCVGRSPSGRTEPKLKDLVVPDLTDYSAVEAQLTGYDACLWCLGISSVGLSEAEYTRITYDYTVAAAKTLARLNPSMSFIFISGASTDGTEKGSVMWARVKGKAENAVLALPFKGAYCFRPGFIQPLHGIKSRTKLYNTLYPLLSVFIPIGRALAPQSMLTTEQLGKAMLKAARVGAPVKVLEAKDINALMPL